MSARAYEASRLRLWVYFRLSRYDFGFQIENSFFSRKRTGAAKKTRNFGASQLQRAMARLWAAERGCRCVFWILWNL